jgi:predicted nucleotidyltransferase
VSPTADDGGVVMEPSLQRLIGPIGQRVLLHRARLLDVATHHGIRNLVVFGSVARGEDGPESDVDLAGDLPHGMGLIGLGRAREDLEAVLGCHVDLVPIDQLKTGVREKVRAEMIKL